MYSTIIKQLDASRRLEEELKLQRHQQEIQKQKIDIELENLKRSRKDFIQSQMDKSSQDYTNKLKEDADVTKEHLQRQKKSEIERSKIAQSDFQRERDQLVKQRNRYDHLQKQYNLLDRSMLELQNRSKLAHDLEERRVTELQLRRKQITRLLDDSRQREMIHYQRSKQLTA